MNAQSQHKHPSQPRWFSKPWNLAGLTLIIVVAFFVLREHWGHVAGFWPYLLLLACPLMHLFHGHGGHGHHHGSARDEGPK